MVEVMWLRRCEHGQGRTDVTKDTYIEEMRKKASHRNGWDNVYCGALSELIDVKVGGRANTLKIHEDSKAAVREAAAAANERNPPKKKKKTSETKTRKASKPTLEDDSSEPSQRLKVRGAKSSFPVLATRSSRRTTPFDVTGRRQIAYDSLIRKASIQERSTRSAEMWEQALLIAHSEMQDYLNAVGAAGED
jgi:hypothetical protein